MSDNQSSVYQRYKLINPCRDQIEMKMACLDDLIPSDHKVRVIWEFVDKMDIDSCFEEMLTYKHSSGRPTTTPKVLLCLWIYSIIDGNISARKIDELCQFHDVYKWIAGNTPINRTMLTDFRSKNPEKFEELLTSCLAVLIQSDLLSDQDFSQDGTRVKASAGFNSYRREESLEDLKKLISEHVSELENELAANPQAYDNRTKAAKKRAVRERSERVDKALENLKKNKKQKIELGKKTGKRPTEEELKDVRASTTEPEVRKMKMGDGGFRLAYNVQFTASNKSKVIYGASVVNTLDPGTSFEMMVKVHSRLRALDLPGAKTWNADSAYSSKEDVEKAARSFPECAYYAPAKVNKGVDPKKNQKNDSEAILNWRKSLNTPEMDASYKDRCSTAEYVNAQTKNHGMTEFLIRGMSKIQGMVNLHAIAHNVNRFLELSRLRERVV